MPRDIESQGSTRLWPQRHGNDVGFMEIFSATDVHLAASGKGEWSKSTNWELQSATENITPTKIWHLYSKAETSSSSLWKSEVSKRAKLVAMESSNADLALLVLSQGRRATGQPIRFSWLMSTMTPSIRICSLNGRKPLIFCDWPPTQWLVEFYLTDLGDLAVNKN